MDSTVMHINKGNALSWGNPKGTHTERKGNAVIRLIPMNIDYYLLPQKSQRNSPKHKLYFAPDYQRHSRRLF